MKTLRLVLIAILFAFVLANIEYVFADNDSTSHLNVTTDYVGRGIMVNSNQTMSPFLPSPPLGMYPYTSKIFSVFQIDPEIVHPNDTSAIRILVTNNANFTLYDVNLGESVNDSKSIMFSDIHKIDILNPNQTKTIFGTLHVSSDVRPTDYYDVWWNVVAKNQTGNMMESMQFHRNLPIVQNLPQYCCDKPVTITLKSPLKQFKGGTISILDVKCMHGFERLVKTSDGSPACVTPLSGKILIEKGWATRTIKVQNTDFEINYAISGGKLTGATENLYPQELILSLQTSSDGYLTVNIPKGLINLRNIDYWTDGTIYVSTNHNEINFKQYKSLGYVVITIPLKSGMTRVEIGSAFSGLAEEGK